MKLLIITALAAFDTDIKKMLKEADVKTFTYKEVKGYKDTSEDDFESNWFASELNENESILYYAFVENGNVDSLFEKVKEYNAHQKSLSKIHVASINIEKSN